MSNYIYPRCQTCDKGTISDINRGDDILLAIWQTIPHLKMALDEDISGYLEVNIQGYGSEMIHFMIEHMDHDIWVMSEYGPDNPCSHKLLSPPGLSIAAPAETGPGL